MNTYDQSHKHKTQDASLPSTTATHAIPSPSFSTNTVQRAQNASNVLQPGEVLALQRSMGNRAVGNLLGRNQSQGAQPNVIQRQPLNNTIQRNPDDDGNNFVNPTPYPITLSEEESASLGDNWFRRVHNIPNNVPNHVASPKAINKKVGLGHRFLNKVGRGGARVIDKARTTVTNNKSDRHRLRNKVDRWNREKRLQAISELKLDYYRQQLSPNDTIRLNQELIDDENSFKQRKLQEQQEDKQSKKEDKHSKKYQREREKEGEIYEFYLDEDYDFSK